MSNQQTRLIVMRVLPIARRKPLFLIVSLAVLLLFVLAACGPTGGSGPSTTATPTPTPPPGPGNNAPDGCPSRAAVTTPPQPDVTIKLSQANAPVIAHVGQVVEIQLPSALSWTGPTSSGGGLQLQTPAGYLSATQGMCIWRFKALSVGTTHLTFFARPICKQGQLCPQYVVAVSFTIEVK